MEQVAGVDAAGFGKKVDGVLGVRQRRCQITVAVLAGVLPDEGHRFRDHRPLFIHTQPIGIAGVVQAVAEKFPLPLGGHRDHFGVVDQHGGGQGHRAADAEGVEHAHQPARAHAVAPIARGVAQHIGRGPWPGFALGVGGRVQLIELYIRRHPHCNACTTGPGDARPAWVRRVGVEARVGFHFAR